MNIPYIRDCITAEYDYTLIIIKRNVQDHSNVLAQMISALTNEENERI
jgi:hypothetical protein